MATKCTKELAPWLSSRCPQAPNRGDGKLDGFYTYFGQRFSLPSLICLWLALTFTYFTDDHYLNDLLKDLVKGDTLPRLQGLRKVRIKPA
jgi:hypothetical protein